MPENHLPQPKILEEYLCSRTAFISSGMHKKLLVARAYQSIANLFETLCSMVGTIAYQVSAFVVEGVADLPHSQRGDVQRLRSSTAAWWTCIPGTEMDEASLGITSNSRLPSVGSVHPRYRPTVSVPFSSSRLFSTRKAAHLSQ